MSTRSDSWQDVHASRRDVDAYAVLGPYEFSREQYERALARARGEARLD